MFKQYEYHCGPNNYHLLWNCRDGCTSREGKKNAKMPYPASRFGGTKRHLQQRRGCSNIAPEQWAALAKVIARTNLQMFAVLVDGLENSLCGKDKRTDGWMCCIIHLVDVLRHPFGGCVMSSTWWMCYAAHNQHENVNEAVKYAQGGKSWQWACPWTGVQLIHISYCLEQSHLSVCFFHEIHMPWCWYETSANSRAAFNWDHHDLQGDQGRRWNKFTRWTATPPQSQLTKMSRRRV